MKDTIIEKIMKDDEEFKRKANELLERAKNITSGLDFNILSKSGASAGIYKKKTSNTGLSKSTTRSLSPAAKKRSGPNSSSRTSTKSKSNSNARPYQPPSSPPKRTKQLSYQELMEQAKNIDAKEFGFLSVNNKSDTQDEKRRSLSVPPSAVMHGGLDRRLSGSSFRKESKFIHTSLSSSSATAGSSFSASSNKINNHLSSMNSYRNVSRSPLRKFKSSSSSNKRSKAKIPVGLIALNKNKRDRSTIEDQQEEINAKKKMQETKSASKRSIDDLRNEEKSKKRTSLSEYSKQSTLSHSKQYGKDERELPSKKGTLSRSNSKFDDEEGDYSTDSEYRCSKSKKQKIKSGAGDKRGRRDSNMYDEEYVNTNYSSIIQQMFGYNRNRYVDDDDVSDMEADYDSLRREEARSTRIAKLEDEREEELEKQMKQKKIKTK